MPRTPSPLPCGARYRDPYDVPSPGPWIYSTGSVWLPEPKDEHGYPRVGVAMRCSVPDTWPMHLRIPAWEKDRNLKLCAAAPELRDMVIRLIDAERDRRDADEPEPPTTTAARDLLSHHLGIDF